MNRKVKSLVLILIALCVLSSCVKSDMPEVGVKIISQNGDIYKNIGGNETDDKAVKLSSIVAEEINSILVMGYDGSHEYIYTDAGYFEREENKVNFFTDDKSQCYTDIAGVMINPPDFSVMDAFYDSQHYLENDEKVMLIFLDGLSYGQYEYIAINDASLFMSNIYGIQRASTVFKPVTNAGFAAMITGKSPKENDVLNRDYREIKTDTVFDVAESLGKKSLLIEGEIKILNTDCELILNIDANGDGYTDDEVFTEAIDNIDNDYDFMLVHFHGIDDAGHYYGPFGDKTLNRIKIIDEYIMELVMNWDGKVIIAADHGMHETTGGGSHGEFRTEDMFVPYAVISGGEYEK